jgi:hypothetical protein
MLSTSAHSMARAAKGMQQLRYGSAARHDSTSQAPHPADSDHPLRTLLSLLTNQLSVPPTATVPPWDMAGCGVWNVVWASALPSKIRLRKGVGAARGWTCSWAGCAPRACCCCVAVRCM